MANIMSMEIAAVLFDADGVIQETTPGWLDHWRRMVRNLDDANAFVSDLFAAEQPHLLGLPGFEDSLRKVMQKWEIHDSLEDILHAWTLIEPSEEALAIVHGVRANGTLACLATNQQLFRHQYMMETLHYQHHFDTIYVSCELKAAKPSTEYFNLIIDQQQLSPEKFLFIDDSDRNVEAARGAGMNAEQFHLSEGIEALHNIVNRYGIPIE